MFDQTIIRICLIVGSLFTAGFILRRVRLSKVQIEDTIFWLVFSAALLGWCWPSSPVSPTGPPTCWAS